MCRARSNSGSVNVKWYEMDESLAAGRPDLYLVMT